MAPPPSSLAPGPGATGSSDTGSSSALIEIRAVLDGPGRGVVTSFPAGLECGDACAFEVSPGTLVTLDATPDEGSRHDAWSVPGCRPGESCTIQAVRDLTVTASFEVLRHSVTVEVTELGDVVSEPALLDCGDICTVEVDWGTELVLHPRGELDADFTGWSGDCEGLGSCSLVVTRDLSAGAAFACPTGTRTLNVAGSPHVVDPPDCVDEVAITLLGASGGAAHVDGVVVPAGGAGGRLEGVLPLVPGDELVVFVGGQGTAGTSTSAGKGGANGGGNGASVTGEFPQAGGGGGGASDVRLGGDRLDDRVLVAGAGGGAASCSVVGFEGAPGGGAVGADAGGGCNIHTLAMGGSQSAGGVGGWVQGQCTGTSGRLGEGGFACIPSAGGGGGAGYYGGGGGAFNPGAGGSSFAHPSVTNVVDLPGQHTGDGEVTLTW